MKMYIFTIPSVNPGYYMAGVIAKSMAEATRMVTDHPFDKQLRKKGAFPALLLTTQMGKYNIPGVVFFIGTYGYGE